ncbi:hypothetical protein BO70DRAFT_36320 [Aspergillus heteromorphus CBS 117.55]|uniref:RRM domain-containing protein n=1 Tax=Aspergillus heteromorphus CBS 117.55 TaxID=1448321 RepID=A0A317W727_9EURO|nr:uncharacterized protein BO70DRAFT_36320 [Aspergillus heteromorphus CBS 117.55]PWY82193.1 hypothetical protein BO70DRAFT_36320 [Aspergillus heteromorphus CBS 117.55]
MATEDDNFDIDIYGDGGGYNANDQGDYKPEDETKQEDTDLILDAPDSTSPNQGDGSSDGTLKPDSEAAGPHSEHVTQPDAASQPPAKETPAPQQAQQGVKRKELDDRPTDPDATPALLISDLYWWTTDDDIRGWIRQADAEDELKDVTFSEHKVNGKSKGQAFLEFTTLQAASAAKHQIESFGAGGQRKHMVTYTSPQPNPFRTLPKDAPMRKDNQSRSMSGGYNASNNMNFGMNNMGGGGGGGFRGGRGGFNNRGGGGGGGGMSGNMGNFGGNRNFQNPMGGFPSNPMVGGFQGNPMGMQNYGFNNRGNMMGGGMRGGPGGMRGRGGGMPAMNPMGAMGMNPMGGMGMNPMSGGMNPMMGQMAGNMGMQGQGFQGPNAAFNQGFFPPNQGVGDGSWNPHGAKRSRQE